MQACAKCGHENQDGARFCSNCGAPLGEDLAREERKVVTVLFADLVGFTARAEGMDPEDVRAVLAPYHARLRTELESHGGTVEKFIGDAVMALFGAPASHEDDPERAVRAALAIRDWIVEEGELELRVAVTTGEALIHLSARPSEGEGMASGDVVNTAARLQAAAPVNGILVDETTYRATEPAIVYEEHAPVPAKGKAEPVSVWEVVEARARFGAEVAAPDTPLIGRKQERELLASALNRARSERVVQLVTLVGVPGIGKSRLVAELFQTITESPELITWRQGRSLPYGDGVTYWALGEMVKNQAGILETDTAEEAAQKLHDEVARLFTDDAEARSVEARLRLLVGIETTAEQAEDKRAESFYAWRRFFEELADKRPAVLVFEDLHWADDDLLDFIDHLVDWAADVPLLCICTARPELLDRRPAWSGGKPSASTISLSPLSDEETARLLGVLLGRAVLPAEQHEIRIFAKIEAGDHMSARILYSGGRFTMTLFDVEGQGSYTLTASAPGAPRRTADWIVEAPAVDCPGTCAPIGLPRFAPVQFTNAHATIGGSRASIDDDRWTHVKLSMTRRNIIRTRASALTSGGTLFHLTWVHS